MEKLSLAVLEAFGLTSRRIKKEKGHYICDTNKGLVKINISNESPKAITLQHSIKEYLAENGFTQTDRYIPAKTLEPYILMGRDTYIATSYSPRHRETDFDNEPEALQAFRSLAYFHTAAKIPAHINLAPGGEQSPTMVNGYHSLRPLSQVMILSMVEASPPLPELYTRQKNELTQAGKQARRSVRLSDFDVAFIKHAPVYSEIIDNALSCLSQTNYQELYTGAIANGSLCHNHLKEENLLASSKETRIVNFAHATIDLQLNDLACLIRRYAQKSNKSLPMGRLLETYDKITPLPGAAADILHPLLIFPWAFMKIVNLYYSKKRNWTPNGLLSRMDTILAQQGAYENYVKM